MLYRRPAENETAVGLLNRMGLFSCGVFRSLIDNGTEAIEYLGDRRTTSMVAQCPPRHFLDSEFPFAQLRLLCCVDSHFVFIGPSLPPREFLAVADRGPVPLPRTIETLMPSALRSEVDDKTSHLLKLEL